MRRGLFVGLASVLILAGIRTVQAEQAQGPTDPKAKKTYATGLDRLQQHDYLGALESFKKADKQDGGHCQECEEQVITIGLQVGDYKAADEAAQEVIARSPANDGKRMALAHEDRAAVLFREAMNKNNVGLYAEADKECKSALAAYHNFPDACFLDGLVLGHLKQDNEAKAQFQQFVAMTKEDSANRARALRFIEQPELVRARMAPAFSVTTLDGQRVSLDGLQGEVVLIDFWATWCGPCREALPHIQEIAKKFQGQPLVILSVSLDRDEAKWKDFVAKNNMTWLQYRDGYFDGPIAKLFRVDAIPHTFTIDPDGVLQDEHVGDAAIEGKLKKLCARARQLEEFPKAGSTAGQ